MNEKTIETKKDSQARDWAFTVNNPKFTEQEMYNYLQTLSNVRYFIFAREKGDGTDGNPIGTEHHQGYIEFTAPKRFSTMKSTFSEAAIGVNAHIKPRLAKRIDNVNYVKKIGKHADKAHTRISEVFEYGEFVQDGDRSDLHNLRDKIEQGADDIELAQEHIGAYARHLPFVDRYREKIIRQKFGKIRRLNLEVTYIYGDTGLGKTRYVMDKYGDENVYRITDYEGNLFDNYENEDVIVFEEFRSQVRIDLMLNYLDVYPLRLPARYNNKIACFTKAYILTNLSLDEQYKNVQREHPITWKAFNRRIHKVFNFDKNRELNLKEKHKQTKLSDLEPIDDDGDLPF